MFYLILAAVLLFLLVVIFRDDNDGHYNKRGETRKPAILPPEQPKKPKPAQQTPRPAQQKPRPAQQAPRPAQQTPKPKQPISMQFKAQTAPKRLLTWTFLYNLKYNGNIVGDTMETEIAGMQYYCSPSDVGPGNGTIWHEPNNPKDPRARVVIRDDGKKIGYLPRYALNEYEAFNDKNLVCPFAGRIRVDQRGFLRADILVALPESREFVKEKLSEYLDNS